MLSRILPFLKLNQHHSFKVTRMAHSVIPKPPNILVQTSKNSSSRLLEQVQSVVSPTRYVVYPIQADQLISTPWARNALLLIIQEKLESEVIEEVFKYLDSGGQVLDFSLNIDRAVEGYVNIKSETIDKVELENILLDNFKVETRKDSDAGSDYSCGYLVSSSQGLDTFFRSKRLVETKTIVQSQITLDFSSELKQPSGNYLPIKTEPSPNFDSSLYLSNLSTSTLGQPLIFVPVISSSMVPFSGGPITHGFTLVPQRQLSGQGRGGNKWLSPPGCSMFSIQIFLKTSSFLGTRPSLIQHLVALAQVHAVRRMEEYMDVDIRLKWPNDIYFGKKVKLGGVIAKGTVVRDDFIVTIGAGLNLNNEHPTRSVNQVIKESGKDELEQEKLLANTFNVLEEVIDKCNNGQFAEVEDLYYKYWLHGDQRIRIIEKEDDIIKNVTVTGIDEFGFLKVIDDNKKEFTVFDDGNSFDMMEGLIRPKTR